MIMCNSEKFQSATSKIVYEQHKPYSQHKSAMSVNWDCQPPSENREVQSGPVCQSNSICYYFKSGIYRVFCLQIPKTPAPTGKHTQN